MISWLGRALCSILGHRWGGTAWEYTHGGYEQVRECRRCGEVDRRISPGR